MLQLKKEVIVVAGIFVTSSLSFALGYLANREISHAPIIIEMCTGLEQEMI